MYDRNRFTPYDNTPPGESQDFVPETFDRRGTPPGVGSPDLGIVVDWEKFKRDSDGRVDTETLDEFIKQVARHEGRKRFDDWLTESMPGIVSRVETGDSILDEPDDPPAVWGSGGRVAWSQGEGLMIFGGQSLGKSTIAQQLVLHRIGVRTGPFLGMEVAVDDRPLVYLAMDRPRQVKRSMHRMVDRSHESLLRKNLVMWSGPMPFSLLADPLRMAEWLQEIAPGCGTVVVDSVKDMAAGIAKDDVGAAINMAWQEIIAGGVEVMSLHHQRKQGSGESRTNGLDDVYGSTWLTSGLGSVLALDGEPGQQRVTMRHLKAPGEQLDEVNVRHDLATGTSTLDVSETRELIDVLTDAGQEGINAREAAIAVHGEDSGNVQKKVKRDLDKMVKEGLASKVPATITSSGSTGNRWVISAATSWSRSAAQSWAEAATGNAG